MIITASHNPSEYNGLKMTFNRQTLNEAKIKEWELEQALERTRRLRPDLLGE